MSADKLLIVVESEPDRRRALADCLRRGGFEVLEAEHAAAALAALGDRIPDALVLDWDFHRDEGRDLLAEMRRHERFRRLPALAVTASESGREAGEVFVRGVELLPGRPLRLGLMAQVLAQAVAFLTAAPALAGDVPRPAAAASEPEIEPVPEPAPVPAPEAVPALLPPASGRPREAPPGLAPSVLLIDDELDHLRALRLWLIRSGYLVETARDGQEGLERLARRRPDVVVLDLNMPRMNGQDFLRHLRASAQLASLPVIVLSAREEPAEPEPELRGTVRLQKPVALEELMRAVNKAVRPLRPIAPPPAQPLSSAAPARPLSSAAPARPLSSAAPAPPHPEPPGPRPGPKPAASGPSWPPRS